MAPSRSATSDSGGVADQVDGGDQEDPVGADPLHVQVADPGDLGVLEQRAQCDIAGERGDGLSGQEVHVAPDQEERDRAEQDADQDRSDRVPERVAGDLVEQDADERDRQAHQGGEVLGEDRAQHRVRGDVQVAQRVQPTRYGGVAGLAQRLQERGALEQEGQGEHGIGPAVRRRLLLGVQRLDTVPDRHRGADGEQPERGEHRPDVADPAVAEGVLGVGWPGGLALPDEQEHLVARVGPRVRGLGGHRGGAGHAGGHGLRDRDEGVRGEGDEHGHQALAALAALGRRWGRLRGGRHPAIVLAQPAPSVRLCRMSTTHCL